MDTLKNNLKTDREQIELEFNAIARVLGQVLPKEHDWQHIREASKAFIEKLNELEAQERGTL